MISKKLFINICMGACCLTGQMENSLSETGYLFQTDVVHGLYLVTSVRPIRATRYLLQRDVA